MKHVIKAVVLVLAGLVLVGNAQAATELVVNGDFESNDLGWTVPEYGVYFGGGPDFATGHSGLQAAQFASADAASLSQTLSTAVGSKYTLSFWLASDAQPSLAQVFWGTQALTPIANVGSDWTQYVFSNLVASSGSTVLSFTGTESGYLFLDDVSVATVAAVPEPATYAMLLAGIGMVGVAARRRRAA